MATSAVRHGSDSDGNLEWKVDISANGKLVETRLLLQDPLDRDTSSRSLCQWYFDAYREKNPFETSKAKSAASLLGRYGSLLAEQLRLATHIGDCQNVLIRIQDAVGADSNSSSSIHQLYWEFLEDGDALGLPSASISVERLATAEVAIAERPAAVYTGIPLLPRRRVNILLVTSRSLEKGAANIDISPSLVLDILRGIKSQLDDNSGHDPPGLDLNVELVRPATFGGMQARMKCRPKGHFDIVHLDMHGAIELDDDGKGSATLRFNDSDSDGTQGVPVAEVARFLSEYDDLAIVLNACDSATASFGEACNAAATFVRVGAATNVLAMVHKTSESAASKCLETFYSELLIHGSSFSEAAKAARSQLRVDPLRNARFHLRIPIADWALAVVYSSGTSLRLPRPSRDTSGIDTPQQPDAPEQGPRARPQPPPTPPHVMFGREFDCLRVEKVLARNGIVYIHGPAGVGKTVLLQHLIFFWQSSVTRQTSCVVYLELGALAPHGPDSFTSILNQISQQAGLERETSLNEADDPELDKLSQLLHVPGRQLTFILDGLADLGKHQPPTPPPFDLGVALIRFLQRLRATRPPGEVEKALGDETLIIASGRPRAIPEFMTAPETGLDWPTLELGGLETSDAISVIRSITKETPTTASLGRGEQNLAGIRKAEPLIQLLQGNPAALTQLVRLSHTASMSLRELYDLLHGENPLLSALDITTLQHSWPLFSEFLHVVSSLPAEWLATWIMLGWFWHDGPVEINFAAALVENGILPKEDGPAIVAAAMQEACRWGYV